MKYQGTVAVVYSAPLPQNFVLVRAMTILLDNRGNGWSCVRLDIKERFFPLKISDFTHFFVYL